PGGVRERRSRAEATGAGGMRSGDRPPVEHGGKDQRRGSSVGGRVEQAGAHLDERRQSSQRGGASGGLEEGRVQAAFFAARISGRGFHRGHVRALGRRARGGGGESEEHQKSGRPGTPRCVVYESRTRIGKPRAAGQASRENWAGSGKSSGIRSNRVRTS